MDRLARSSAQLKAGPLSRVFEEDGGNCAIASVCRLKAVLREAVNPSYEVLDDDWAETGLDPFKPISGSGASKTVYRFRSPNVIR